MERSTERILTTHTGSLPRPPTLAAMMAARARGEPVDADALTEAVRNATLELVRKQLEAGVDVISDGEASKPSYATYVAERLDGFAEESRLPMPADLAAFPRYAERVFADPGLTALRMRACVGDVHYRGHAAVGHDVEVLRAAVAGRRPAEAFITAASPGVISLFHENRHYRTHERYLNAVARAMREEYLAIHQAGFLLQVDCPDLAMGRHIQFPEADLSTFLRKIELHVEALNEAVADIPADAMRIHLCWGNYEGPHHLDVPLRDIVNVVLAARPAGISFVGANPRHEHEVDVWRGVELPEEKVLIPGVVDPTTNFIEHQEVVARRIERFARVAGPERIIAGTDCGFGTFAGYAKVDPDITWEKLRALVDGARVASDRLFGAHRSE